MSIKKADPALKYALKNSLPDETLRAVLQLDVVDDPSAHPLSEAKADRRTLIARRTRLVSEQVGPMKETLGKVGLAIRMTGVLTSMVVVEGTPASVMKALELPIVVQASLDQVIASSPTPTGGESRKGVEENLDHLSLLVAAILAARFRWPADAVEGLTRQIAERLLSRFGPKIRDDLRQDRFGQITYELAKDQLIQASVRVDAEFREHRNASTSPPGSPRNSPQRDLVGAMSGLTPDRRAVLLKRATGRQGWNQIAGDLSLSVAEARALYHDSIREITLPLREPRSAWSGFRTVEFGR